MIFDVECPCCQAMLRIDAETQAVISHKEKERPPAVEDLQDAVKRMKGEPERRDEAFRKSFADHKLQPKILEKKFDELLKQAKESKEDTPPKRPFDFD